ncbi:MAG: pilus assembly protein N-terminal domain-containing protein [Phycisphaerales bacterium]|nr:MAG: pilus assembly protein N-terminal domain-containing protein [Phycisphaerales bacterium]
MPKLARSLRCMGGWLCAIVVIIGLCGALTAKAGVDGEGISLIEGRSVVVTAPWPTVRVAVTDPTVANVEVLTPEQVLVQGLKVGSTDIILWSEDEQQTWQQRVAVRLDVERISKALQTLFPTAELQVSDSDEVLLVQGVLRSADEAEQLRRFLDTAKITYVDTTYVAGVQQVQLQVRVAEVSRDALRQLGMNWFSHAGSYFFGQRLGGLATIDIGVNSGPSVGQELEWTFQNAVMPGSAVTVLGGFPDIDLSFFLQALAENGYLRILANPTVVALSGEQANFLAGGEFPVPVPQGGAGAAGGTAAITIQYKEFGVRLSFLPIVLGDGGIRLHASQEVSQLDFTRGVTIVAGSDPVPALITRRAETTLELASGQSFAMAGLLQRTNDATTSRLPGVGNLPVVGALFRSVRYREEETELVIMVTASVVEPLSAATPPPLPGVTHTAPNDWELYLEGRIEGKEPAKLDSATIQWMKDMGLYELVGPGAWASYENDTRVMEWQEPEQETSERNAETKSAEPESVSEAAQSGPVEPEAQQEK